MRFPKSPLHEFCDTEDVNRAYMAYVHLSFVAVLNNKLFATATNGKIVGRIAIETSPEEIAELVRNGLTEKHSVRLTVKQWREIQRSKQAFALFKAGTEWFMRSLTGESSFMVSVEYDDAALAWAHRFLGELDEMQRIGTIGLNAGYLDSIQRALQVDYVQLEIAGECQPIKIKNGSGDVAAIMPCTGDKDYIGDKAIMLCKKVIEGTSASNETKSLAEQILKHLGGS